MSVLNRCVPPALFFAVCSLSSAAVHAEPLVSPLAAQCLSSEASKVEGRGLALPNFEILFFADKMTAQIITVDGELIVIDNLKASGNFIGDSLVPNSPLLAAKGNTVSPYSGEVVALDLKVGFQMWIGGAYGHVTLTRNGVPTQGEVFCRPLRN
ncbi:MAG TPA: hypothetical protein VE954_18465 [Oligoflexus sp.]|uniref:hypothetical protein n=1 Tax=Oligoflexus sp. TaxID=1971216 RepID=UPI002D7462F7|nr:hypothetical protein [Oligoflexus sp.]HYX35086.1 hypothetical protein [Oligoflexus sp.]